MFSVLWQCSFLGQWVPGTTKTLRVVHAHLGKGRRDSRRGASHLEHIWSLMVRLGGAMEFEKIVFHLTKSYPALGTRPKTPRPVFWGPQEPYYTKKK